MIAGKQCAPRLKPGITLYVVRHGETDWNRDARYQGQRDIPINDKGRAQARRQGQTLKLLGLKFDELDFVSSPLIRAIETMRIMRAELGLDVENFRRDNLLCELNYGHWEGRYASELPYVDPTGLAEKVRDPYRWRPNGGESYCDLQQRIETWLDGVTQSAIVVTHGGVSRVLRGALLDIPAEEIPFLEVPQDRILVVAANAMSWL